MTFIFDSFSFERATLTAKFHYQFNDGQKFTETVRFAGSAGNYNAELLNRALFLAHIVIGTSYLKTFPTPDVEIKSGKIDAWQAGFFNLVFQEGLSQFAYENNLTRANLAQFRPTTTRTASAFDYDQTGVLALQSGGKDSLLLATMLVNQQDTFTPWYIANGGSHPKILDDLGQPLLVAQRQIDRENLSLAAKHGALNGHVPVTYIVESLALIQAILLGKNVVLAAIAHEGEEPRDMIDDLAINHQWSKTWRAEQNLSEYVARYLAPQMQIGSPLRQYSELMVAELFVRNCWTKFGHRFSSCNVANYRQSAANADLKWCGECAKCANTWLLLAPFVAEPELKRAFDVEQDLFARSELTDTFKGLLGIDGMPKPFECVGEVDELRAAYHMAEQRGGYAPLNFHVPESDFDYRAKYEHNGNLSLN